jgi:hypothetical protein
VVVSGQKQTCAPQKAMSALPPIATLIAYFHEGGSVARLQLRTEFAQRSKVLPLGLIEWYYASLRSLFLVCTTSKGDLMEELPS